MIVGGFWLFRKVALFLQRRIGRSRWLRKMERRLIAGAPRGHWSPIFILGAPRSGTTFLFQSLATRFHTAYITNLQSLLMGSPVLVAALAKKCGKNICDGRGFGFVSRYGYTPGLFAPSEAAPLFRSWFGDVETGAAADWPASEVQAAVSALSHLAGGPFLSKDLMDVFRIDYLKALFPDAVFVSIRRQPAFVVQSLLEWRAEEHGDWHGWSSLRPPGLPDPLPTDPIEQVVLQVRSIEQAIAEALDALPGGQVFEVDYGDLCADPESTLARFSAFWTAAGRPALRTRDALPIEVRRGDVVRVPSEVWAQIEQALAT